MSSRPDAVGDRRVPDPRVARRMTILLSGWEEPPRATAPPAPPPPRVGWGALFLGLLLSAPIVLVLGLARPADLDRRAQAAVTDLDRRARAAVQAFLSPRDETAAAPVSPLPTPSPRPQPPPRPATGASASVVTWPETALPGPEAARRVVEGFLQALGGDGPAAETALTAWAPEAQETARTLLAARGATRVVRVRDTWVEPVPGARTLLRVGAVLDLLRGDHLLSTVVQVYLVRLDEGRWVITARLQ